MLDWLMVFHQHGPHGMGGNHRAIATHDRQIRAKGWRMFSAQWVQSGVRAQEMLRYIAAHKQSDVNMCLAGTFDGGIYLPMALCAQMYWNCAEDYPETVKLVSSRSCIANDVT